MKPIKIYFTDLKPEKQRELLPKLMEFFDDEIPIPLVEFIDYNIEKGVGTLAIGSGEETELMLGPHERREQDAQIASENQEPEPEREDGKFDF